MKRLFILAIALLSAITIVRAQDGWITRKIDERISVKFPSEPKQPARGTFVAMSKDTSTAYNFTLTDFLVVANIDSATLAPYKATPQFADQLKTGLTQGMPNVNLSDFTIGTWKGFTSYTANGVDPQKKRYDIFMFIIGSKLYTLSTIIMNGKDTKGRDIFFNSVRLSNPAK